MARVSWAELVGAWSEASMAGKAGRYMSMEAGPTAVSRPRRAGSQLGRGIGVRGLLTVLADYRGVQAMPAAGAAWPRLPAERAKGCAVTQAYGQTEGIPGAKIQQILISELGSGSKVLRLDGG